MMSQEKSDVVVYTFRILIAPYLMLSSFSSHGSNMSALLYSSVHLQSR